MGLDGSGINNARSSPVIYRIFYMGAWIVSVTEIVVSYIGLLGVYKKGALHGSRGEGHWISLKITTLPVIMPFVVNILVVLFFVYLFYGLGRAVVFPLYWAVLILYFPYLLSDLSSMIYPILLLYVSSKIRACWKKTVNLFFGFMLELVVACVDWCLNRFSQLV